MPRRLLPVLIISALGCALALAAPAKATEPPSAEQRQQLEQVIHDYLLNNPEVLIEALQAAEKKMKSEQEQQSHMALTTKRDELLHDPASPTAGNPQGDVTIVEFFDYRCPYCKQVEPSILALLKEDPKIRIVYKEFPILGPESLVASRVALAALKQGPQQYERFHKAMMAAKGSVTEASILQIARDASLDVAKIKAEMNAPDIDAVIKRNFDLADELGIRGTPAFIIGDTLAPGAVDLDTLRRMIAEARKPS